MISPAISHAMNFAFPEGTKYKEYAMSLTKEDLTEELSRSGREASNDVDKIIYSGVSDRTGFTDRMGDFLTLMRVATCHVKHYSIDTMRLIYITHIEYDDILQFGNISISEFETPTDVLLGKLLVAALYTDRLCRMSSVLETIIDYYTHDQAHESLVDYELL